MATNAHVDDAVAARRPLTRRRLWAFRIIALLLSVVFAFVVIEVAVRMVMAARPNDIETLRRYNERKQSGSEMMLIDFIRPSRNLRLVYEMIPGVEGTFVKAPFKLNSHGFYDVEWTVEKPPQTFRIALLGDSIQFGWGVPREYRHSDYLEKLLNETSTDGTKYEVLNFAIPGYNTVMEEELLRTKVLQFDPDAVVLGYTFDNDHELPMFVVKARPLFTLKQSFALEALRERNFRSGKTKLQPDLRDPRSIRVPEEYRALEGHENARKSLRGISEIARKNGIPVIFLPEYYNIEDIRKKGPAADPQTELHHYVRELGYVVASPVGDMKQFLERHDWHSYVLWVNYDEMDAHCNPIRHVLYAKALYRQLVQEKILPDWQARQAQLQQHLAKWDQLAEQAIKLTKLDHRFTRPDPDAVHEPTPLPNEIQFEYTPAEQ